MAYIDPFSFPTPEAPPKPYKIALSIPFDDQYGHLMRESYGDRLLVDKEQARRLATVLLEYAGEPKNIQLGMPSEVALIKLRQQLESFLSTDHCNQEAPPAEEKTECPPTI